MSDMGKHLANKHDDFRPQDGAAVRVSPAEVSLAVADEEGAPARSGASVIELPRSPGRPKGTPKTGGRKRGTRNRRTQAVEDAMRPLVPASKRKLKKLLVSDDPKAALSAAALVLAYVYGKPVERIVSDNRNVNAFEDVSTKEAARLILAALREAQEAQDKPDLDTPLAAVLRADTNQSPNPAMGEPPSAGPASPERLDGALGALHPDGGHVPDRP